MKVLVPYVWPLHPLVVRVLRGAAWEVATALVGPPMGDAAYPDLLLRHFREGAAFCVVEHDVLPWPGALAELAACPEPWCGYAYSPGRHLRVPTLGCVRFRAEFLAAVADALTVDAWRVDLFPRTWQYVDQQIAVTARRRGFEWHQHFPAVTHAHWFADPW